MLFTVHCSLKRLAILMGGLLALVFVCGATGGCGGESFVDSTSYQYPNWTPEGLIYCQKAVTHYRKYWGAIGGEYSENRGTDYYYVTMSTEGTNETTLPYTSYPYFSPLGTYVALISGETISIVRRADNTQVHSFSPTTESISELDWGPDEGKLVFLTNNENLYVVNTDSTNSRLLTSECSDISWKHGNKIVYVTSRSDIYGRITTWNNAGETESIYNQARGLEPTISALNTLEVFYRNESNVEKININNVDNVPEVLFRNFAYVNMKLSPDSQKILAGKTLQSGVWIVNIDGSNLTQLK